MCYEALVDGDVREAPVWRLVRRESRGALTHGLVAAAAVLVVGLLAGAPPGPVAAGTVVAVPLCFVVHQLVLVAGVFVLRFSATHTGERYCRL